MPRPGRFEITLSVASHLVVVLIFWLTAFERTPEPEFQAVRLTMVALPAPVEGPPEPAVVEEDFAPIEEPEPDPVDEEPPVVVDEEEEVAEEEPPQDDPPPTPPDSTEAQPATSETVDPEVEEAADEITVRMEGLVRDFPEYYAEIQRHMGRCFRWNGDDRFEGVVQFEIARDGGLNPMPKIAQRSGSVSFDAAAMRAVECAVTPTRIGPLPEGMEWDVLPVLFSFRGSGGAMQLEPGMR